MRKTAMLLSALLLALAVTGCAAPLPVPDAVASPLPAAMEAQTEIAVKTHSAPPAKAECGCTACPNAETCAAAGCENATCPNAATCGGKACANVDCPNAACPNAADANGTCPNAATCPRANASGTCPNAATCGGEACATADCPNAACPNAASCTAGVLGVDKACPAAQGEACALATGFDSVMLPPGCSDVCDDVAEYHKLTPEQAKASMDAGEEYLLVDVRTQTEFDEKHIPGAMLLPNEDIGADAPAALPDKGATILLYCRSGRRSKEAAEKLIAAGYTSVYDFGGIIDWPYETIES